MRLTKSQRRALFASGRVDAELARREAANPETPERRAERIAKAEAMHDALPVELQNDREEVVGPDGVVRSEGAIPR